MIRVLQVLMGLSRGGLETFIVNVYRAIDNQKVSFDFLINEEGGDYEEEVKRYGAQVFIIPGRKRGIRKYRKNLDVFFSQHASDYNAIHYHTSSLSSLEPLEFASKYNIPCRILHSHSSSISGSKIHYILHLINKINVGRWANVYLGCSDKANIWFYRFTGVYHKSRIIPNAINTEEYRYNDFIRDQVREDLSIPKQYTVLGHVGRIMWIKNHKFLVDVFHQYHKTNPNSFLLIVGTGPLRSEIETKVHDLGLSENVKFLGVRDDIPRILQVMDCFVMPSFYEGLPMVLVEAQSSGLPVVCSNTISKDANLSDLYHELDIKSSPETWAKYIDKIVATAKRKDTAYIIKDKGFDISNTAEKLIQIYESEQYER